ncbi:MAG TPA: class D sortase [Bryobacteraceae bacterium]|jgi:sortase A
MIDTGTPVVIRRNPESPHTNRPGVHSRNSLRTRPAKNRRSSVLRFIQILLLIAGMGATGYYAYVLSDQYVYQAFENWAFDQQIAGRPAVTFADYVREQTPFGFLAGPKAASPASSTAKPAPAPGTSEIPRPAEGALLGRVEIARLNLAAIVREGVDAKTLGIAVGHVPSTSLPGQEGNFAIAAHRDTLFRALKDIKEGDLVNFQSAAGTYTYQVAATKIVKPSDVSVLRADGGGIISGIDPPGQAPGRLLTMITCYPFYYVGSAPKRFIVEARLILDDAQAKLSETTVQVPLPAAVIAGPKPRAVRPPAPPADARASHFSGWQNSRKSKKKRGFWHTLFHIPNK